MAEELIEPVEETATTDEVISGGTPAEDAPAEQQEIEAEEPSTEASEEDQPKKRGGVQKRLDELTANWREEQRRAQRLETLLESALAQKAPEQPKEEPKPIATEPKAEDFDTYDQYVTALADHRAEQKVAEALARIEQDREKAEAARQKQEIERTFQQRVDAFRSTAPDFDEVAFNPSLPVTDVMADAINSSENGPQVLYWLGKNPAEAERIASLNNPIAVGREIGRVEVKLTLPEPRNKTSAPPPISPMDSGGGAVAPDPEKMTTDEWLAWRNKQIGRTDG